MLVAISPSTESIDNFAVVAVARAEPASLTLFGTGIAGLASLRRRRA